jgi:hypothetical protein
VSEYGAGGLPTDRQTVEANVHANLDEFGPAGVNTEQVVHITRELSEF